eukprot:1473559-Rhodomonas_salina.3
MRDVLMRRSEGTRNMLIITDPASANGTRVDGETLQHGQPRELQNGQNVVFGQFQTVFVVCGLQSWPVVGETSARHLGTDRRGPPSSEALEGSTAGRPAAADVAGMLGFPHTQMRDSPAIRT